MNIMEKKQISASYSAPLIELHEVVAEGMLCQSVAGMRTEEWDVIDLSKM